jgi:ABC-type nitrate/sulfonate/bicarbonate transport system substrate-binding protein
MAYVSNETKQKVQAALKPVFKKYGIKATVAKGSYASSLVVNVSAGDIDFGTDYQQVNIYWIDDNHTGKAKDFLNEVLREIKRAGEWYDESDSQIDYFNTAFYISINIGRWDKPYKLNNKVSLDDVLEFKALKELGKLQLIYVK